MLWVFDRSIIDFSFFFTHSLFKHVDIYIFFFNFSFNVGTIDHFLWKIEKEGRDFIYIHIFFLRFYDFYRKERNRNILFSYELLCTAHDQRENSRHLGIDLYVRIVPRISDNRQVDSVYIRKERSCYILLFFFFFKKEKEKNRGLHRIASQWLPILFLSWKD